MKMKEIGMGGGRQDVSNAPRICDKMLKMLFKDIFSQISIKYQN